MIKTIIKLAIVILIANATWRIGTAYLSYYRFKDAVSELALHSTGKTDEQLREKVLDLAAMYDEPLPPDALSVRQEEQHTYIDGTYTKPVAVLPGYEYQWPFSLRVDGFVVTPVKLGDLANPQ